LAVAEQALASRLLGAWRLTGYLAEASNGEAIYPLGADASGYIMYTPDGHVSACVMRANRLKLASLDAMGGTQIELAAAAGGYLSYAGTFDVDETSGVVTHHLRIALVPNGIGNDFKRKIILDGDKLELRALAPSLVGGELRLVRVLWERARK
jgi:hypothetical protein